MHGIPLPRMTGFGASGPALELWHTMEVDVCEANVAACWRWMGGDARARAAAGMAAAVGPAGLGC